ncbi:MAG: hypothetical protein GY829_05155 [Gammaproteobacteria bacterium]|nr:hypothetical protein [Gammaproteobacteria bacterium]
MHKWLPIILLAFLTQVQAESFCEKRTNIDELDMVEDDFNFERARKSAEYVDECIRATGTALPFEKQIGCINSMVIVEGALLKQNALLLKLHYQSSKKNKDKTAFEQAVKKYCVFVKEAKYID